MAADGWRAVGPELRRRPDSTVLVLGGMPPVTGIHAAGLAAVLGAPRVVYCDPDPRRQAAAAGFGAKCLASPEALGGEQFDIVVVANPMKAILEAAFAHLAPAGLVVSVSPTADGAPVLDTPALYHQGARWTIGRPDCRHCHDGVMEAWAIHGFRPGQVPATPYAWDDAPEAWAADTLYVAAVRG
jgi:threonine dehydrogenase-like Zn-dependent dehydrogenase